MALSPLSESRWTAPAAFATTMLRTARHEDGYMKLLWKCNCGGPPIGDRNGMSSLFLCTICRPDQARVGLGEFRQVLGSVSIDRIGLCMFRTLLGSASTDRLSAPTPLPARPCIRIIFRFFLGKIYILCYTITFESIVHLQFNAHNIKLTATSKYQ